jgi:hypothetical protein
MLRKYPIVLLTLLSLVLCQGPSPAASGFVGSPAPYFSVWAADEKEVNLNMIRGKIAVILYENKDIVAANQKLKDELKALYAEQPPAVKDIIVRLPVIDCSSAVWAFRWLWKRQLIAHSKKEGMPIYCDWDGKMFSAYGMKDGVSNVLLIDKVGRVRFFASRELDATEIAGVKELLKTLAKE